MLAEPYRLEKRDGRGGKKVNVALGRAEELTVYHLTRADIPRERLDLQIIARTETERMVAERVLAALAAFEGTPTALIMAGGPQP